MKKSLGFAALSAGAMLAGSGIASAQEAPPPPDHALSHLHSVVAGESLSTIALAELGTPDRWVEIFALNHTALASPEVVRVGQVLDIPSPPVPAVAVAAPVPEAAPPSDQPPARPYTVVPGDSLSTISQTELGAADRWVEIFTLNRDGLPDPQVIGVGQVLALPLAPVAVPADLLASLVPVPVRASAPARPAAATTAVAATTAPQAVRTTGSAGGGSLSAIRACESSGNYGAVSADGLYRGAYQFDLQTWRSVGGSGDPASASASEQDARAAQLLSQRGSNPWPNCG